jgi:hypothetical protein
MSVLYPLAILVDGFVDGLIHQGLKVGSTPLISCLADVGHHIFLYIVQNTQLFVKDLP